MRGRRECPEELGRCWILKHPKGTLLDMVLVRHTTLTIQTGGKGWRVVNDAV